MSLTIPAGRERIEKELEVSDSTLLLVNEDSIASSKTPMSCSILIGRIDVKLLTTYGRIAPKSTPRESRRESLVDYEAGDSFLAHAKAAKAKAQDLKTLLRSKTAPIQGMKDDASNGGDDQLERDRMLSGLDCLTA